VEWLVAIALLTIWVPGVEGKGLSSIGIEKSHGGTSGGELSPYNGLAHYE
jgi:hypothetical protein